MTILAAILEKPEVLSEARSELFRERALFACEDPRFRSLFSWQSVDDVPEDIAFTLAANSPINFHKEPSALLHILLLLPWLAECEAQDLYLPKKIVDALHEPWSAKLARKLLQDEGDRLGKAEPVRVEKRAGRNDPCPCGSGKKYKKCCINEPLPNDAPTESE